MSHPLENCLLSASLPNYPIVIIVKFDEKLAFGLQIPQTPAVHFQVTAHAGNISPSGRYIRFGGTKGDELTGWMVREYLVVCEVLGELGIDGTTVMPCGYYAMLDGEADPNDPGADAYEAAI